MRLLGSGPIRHGRSWLVLLAVLGVLVGGAVPAAAAPARWKPAPDVTWQWQLQGRLDMTVPATVYDVDGFETTKAQVAALHSRGRKAICYISAGSFENWRPDAARFPAVVKGRNLDGWPGERWLDIRSLAVLRPIMAARIDMCAAKGFDAVEPDNVDGYANRSGFPLTGAHQLAYNRMLATLAHDRGLSVALKNDVEQAGVLAPAFDFAINEECFEYRECSAYAPFTNAGKAVLHVEYEAAVGAFCPTTTRLGFSSMRKHWSLDAWRQAC